MTKMTTGTGVWLTELLLMGVLLMGVLLTCAEALVVKVDSSTS